MKERYEMEKARLMEDAKSQMAAYKANKERDNLIACRSRCLAMAVLEFVINGTDVEESFNSIYKEVKA